MQYAGDLFAKSHKVSRVYHESYFNGSFIAVPRPTICHPQFVLALKYKSTQTYER